MMWLGAAIAVVSAIMGFQAGSNWKDAMLQLAKDKHKREMDEIFEEVKRLRAQNALLIGKE